MSYIDGSQSPVYFQSVRRMCIAFSTVFNDITLIRFDSSGIPATTQKVPLVYGPKSHWVEKLNEKAVMTSNNGRNVELQTTLPRMSFMMGTISYDKTRQLNPLNNTIKRTPSSSSQISQLAPVPYNIEMELTLYSKTTEDGLMILEQILPMFSPHLNIKIKEIDAMEIYQDLAIVLDDVKCDDNYASGYSENRMITWDLNFTMQGLIFPPLNTAPIILKTIVDFKNSYLDIPAELERVEVLALQRTPPDFNKDNSSVTIVDETRPGYPAITPPPSP